MIDERFQSSGLSAKDLRLIGEAIKNFPTISQAKIFGSRAKGNYKTGSDVDIAIFFNSSTDPTACKQTLSELSDLLEESLPLPYFFDIVDFKTIQSRALKEHIERVGIVIQDGVLAGN